MGEEESIFPIEGLRRGCNVSPMQYGAVFWPKSALQVPCLLKLYRKAAAMGSWTREKHPCHP